MATVACPECDTHVDVPDGTRKGVKVDCPSCTGTFLTPELPRPEPAPVTTVGGRSDYLDAENFTPVKKPAKPKRPPLSISGTATVICVIGSVGIAAVFGSMFIYSVLKVQGRVASGPGESPLGRDSRPGLPLALPEPAQPARRDDPPPQLPPVEPAQQAVLPQPMTAEEAWSLLVGTWTLNERPKVEAEDEGSVLTRLRFAADRSAVLTDNLHAATKGETRNFDDPHSLNRVEFVKGGVTLHLKQTSSGESQLLPVTFDGRDRIIVEFKPRQAGPAYLFKFIRS